MVRHDFYFSKRQQRVLTELSETNYRRLINGKRYTRMVKAGEKPGEAYDDYVLVARNVDLNEANLRSHWVLGSEV